MKTNCKYRAIKTEVDGVWFASKAEARHYSLLKAREERGEITHLILQPAWPIVINGKKVCTYKADFSYRENGNLRVIDVKGMLTPVYRLKKKLVESMYPGTTIEEVR